MYRLTITVAICLSIFGSTSATDQHLICKSVDDIFSSDVQAQSTRRLQGPSQGRPGKIGPRGFKGEIGQKGERGNEGIVDYSTVNHTLERMVASANAELQAKVEKLENIINKAFSGLGDCADGFVFGVKCYFVKIQTTNSRSHGEQICSGNNGWIVDIQTQAHQRLVTNYVRGKIPDGRSYIAIWVALHYESSTGTVRLSDGRSLPASALRWYPDYPRGSYTGFRLGVRLNASDYMHGIYNLPENNGGADGVLCEK